MKTFENQIRFYISKENDFALANFVFRLEKEVIKWRITRALYSLHKFAAVKSCGIISPACTRDTSNYFGDTTRDIRFRKNWFRMKAGLHSGKFSLDRQFFFVL